MVDLWELYNYIVGLWNDLVNIWNTITSLSTWVIQQVAALIGLINGAIAAAAAALAAAIKNVLVTVTNMITVALAAVYSWTTTMINNLTASVNRALQDLSQGMAYLQQYLTTWINNRVAEVVALLNAFQVWVIASIKDAQVALTKLNVDLVSLATKTTKEIADRAAAITKLQKDLQKWTTDQVLILLLQALDKAVGA